MSCNRENVTWQSKDGSWSRGFYEFYSVNTESEDWDSEWDVEYGDEFNWVSSGHATEEQADAAWTGSNPGGGMQLVYAVETAAQCEALDEKARRFKAKRQQERSAGAVVTLWR